MNKALHDAKDLFAQNQKVEIVLSSGTYYLDDPIALGADFSGTDNAPFIIRAESNAQVVLSAGGKFDPDWRKHSGSIVKASISYASFDQLYINGERQIRARYPNYDPSILVFNGFAENAIDAERIAFWKEPAGGYVHSLHEARWGGMHHEIKGVDDSGALILDGGFQNNRASAMHEKYRYVENIFEELDAPGEWYYSESGSTPRSRLVVIQYKSVFSTCTLRFFNFL